jgi:hypothetical protein
MLQTRLRVIKPANIEKTTLRNAYTNAAIYPPFHYQCLAEYDSKSFAATRSG